MQKKRAFPGSDHGTGGIKIFQKKKNTCKQFKQQYYFSLKKSWTYFILWSGELAIYHKFERHKTSYSSFVYNIKNSFKLNSTLKRHFLANRSHKSVLKSKLISSKKIWAKRGTNKPLKQIIINETIHVRNNPGSWAIRAQRTWKTMKYRIIKFFWIKNDQVIKFWFNEKNCILRVWR